MDIIKYTKESKLNILINGKGSNDFNLINVSKAEGVYSENLLGTRSLTFENLEQNGHFILNSFNKEQVVIEIKLAYIDTGNDVDAMKDSYMEEVYEWLYGSYEDRYKPRKLEFEGVDGYIYGYVNDTPVVSSDGRKLMFIEFEFYCTTSYFMKDIDSITLSKGSRTNIDIAKNEILHTELIIDNTKSNIDNSDVSVLLGENMNFTINNIVEGDIVTVNLASSTVRSKLGRNYYNNVTGYLTSIILTPKNNSIEIIVGDSVLIQGKVLINY